MGVSVQAQGKGGVSLGGAFDLGQLGGTSPAAVSAGLFLVLLAVVILIALSAR